MIRSVFFIFLVSFSLSVFGQRSFIFNRFSRNDGLNTNSVNCVWQDNKGFLWIGTENGIQRYDGRKFISFKSVGTEHEIPPFGVDQILNAGEGKMWIRQGNLVGLFDPVSFHYTSIPVDFGINLPVQSELNLYSDSKGNTFLFTHKTGLLHFDKSQKKFTTDNLPVQIPTGWTVNSLFEDSVTGDYWICSDKGLAVYQSKTKTLVSQSNNPQHLPFFENRNLIDIYSFFIDKDRTYWIIRWDFSPEIEPVLIHFDPLKNKVLNDINIVQPTGTEFQGPFWINETKLGQLWIGGVNTLVCFDPKQNIYVQNKKINPAEYDIKFREIKQLFEDRENNVWLATDNGLYLFTLEQNNSFNVVFNQHGQNNDIVINAIQETQDLENWIGTWENGIIVFDKYFVKTNFDLYKTINDKNLVNYRKVWDLYQHSKSGLIWVGCQNGTLTIFNPQTKMPVELLNPTIFENAPIRQILEDNEGNLFFGTQKGRLAKWKNGTETGNESFEFLRDFNSMIFLLFKDNIDRIWVGTRDRGLFVMDPSGKNVQYHFNKQPGSLTFTGTSVYDVVQYNDSIYFVSTGFLNILNLNSGEIKTLTQNDGLPGAGLTQLMLDDEGVLWFNHNNGLGSYNFSKHIFVSYNERNGIIMSDKSIHSKFKMRNGEFWFGGENALFGFSPEGLKFNTAPPNVTLTDFKLFNKFIPLDSLLMYDKVKLKPYQNSITVYFSSLSFTQQDKLQYFYKMEGVDMEWIRAERDLAANYTTLAPGEYNFKVKCINMQGIESASITSLLIDISPYFYQTRWFMLLIFLSVFLLIYVFYRLRLIRLLAVERIRNKVARDLHDDVGSILSTINILSSMAKTKLLTDPVKTSEYISKITNNSQQMMEAMDDIVWSIKPDNDNMQRIVARMREYTSSILEPKDIEIDFQIDENIFDLKLNMETRRDVFLIFKEALNNSAKYSHCTKIDISVKFEGNKLIIRIIDNGTGFDIKTADSGNGLGNMSKRAEALHGTIDINSNLGKGTEIILTVPVKR